MHTHQLLAKSLATSIALCFTGSLLAQGTPGDDCTGALTIPLGVHGPFTTVGATTSTPSWPCALGGNDVWFKHTSTGISTLTASLCGSGYDTAIEVFDGSAGCGTLVSIGCNDDSCGLQSSISWPAANGTDYYIRVGGYNGSTGTFTLDLTQVFNFEILGAVEATPFSSTLAVGNGTFADNEFIRWNLSDPGNQFPGLFSAVGLNFGVGTQQIGSTPGLPGLELLWQGSTPAGAAFILPPNQIGGPDFLLSIPSGIFSNGDSIRVQGLVLAPAVATGPLPVVATENTLEYTFFGAWSGQENFDSGLSLPLGWTNSGPNNWTVDANGTSSTATGPTAANSLPNYLYCETSIAHPGLFILDLPPFPSSSAPNNRLEFQLSRIGAAIATLNVQMDDGTGTFVTLATYTGPDPTQGQGAIEWSFESIDITNGGTIVPPATLKFRFEYSGTTTFTADIALDDISVN